MTDTWTRAQELGAPFPCRICGEEERLSYVEDTQRLLAHHRLCFNCAFWVERWWTHITNKYSVVSEGEAYIAYDYDPKPGSMRGYGGRLVKIVPVHGHRRYSNNVWHQGTIPEWMRPYMPDNAEIIWNPSVRIGSL